MAWRSQGLLSLWSFVSVSHWNVHLPSTPKLWGNQKPFTEDISLCPKCTNGCSLSDQQIVRINLLLIFSVLFTSSQGGAGPSALPPKLPHPAQCHGAQCRLRWPVLLQSGCCFGSISCWRQPFSRLLTCPSPSTNYSFPCVSPTCSLSFLLAILQSARRGFNLGCYWLRSPLAFSVFPLRFFHLLSFLSHMCPPSLFANSYL